MKYLLVFIILVSASCGQLPADDAPTSTETTRAPSRPSTETTPPPPEDPPDPDTEEQLKTLESPSTTTKRSYPTTADTTLPSTPPLLQCGVNEGENYAYFLEIRTTPSISSDVKEFLDEGKLDVQFVCDKIAEFADGRVGAYSPNGSPCASVEQKGLRLNMTFIDPPPLEDDMADLCSATAELLGAMIHAEIATIHAEKAKELAKKARDSIMKCLVTGDVFTLCHNPDAEDSVNIR